MVLRCLGWVADLACCCLVVLGLIIICRLALVLGSGLLRVLVWVGGCYLVWVFGRLVTLGLRWLC